MKKERQMKTMVILALVISVIAIGVGFAAFSTTLTINGSATVNSIAWDIHFGTVSRTAANSTDGIGTVLPTVKNGTSTTGNTNNIVIEDFSVTFTTNNQKVEYIIPVVNDGSYNAKLTAYTPGGTATCTTNNATDCTNVINHLHYSLVWQDSGLAPAVNDTLDSSATKNLKLTISYWPETDASQNPSELPVDPVTVNFSSSQLTYGQN